MENTVGPEQFGGIIRPEESVVNYVRAAYSPTNTAELELC